MIAKKSVKSLAVYYRLLNYVKTYWKAFAISIFGFLLYSSSQPMLASVFGWLASAVYENNKDAIYLIPLSFLGIYIIRGIGSFIGNYFLSKVSFSIIKVLRIEIFDRLILLPNNYYEKNNSGHLISLITYNVTQVTAAATGAIKVLIREGIAVVALFGYLLYLNWLLTLVFVAIAPVIALIVKYTSKRFKNISTKIQDSMGDLTHVSSEAIHGYKEIKSFGGEAYEKERFYQANEINYKHNMKLIKTSSINTPVLQIVVAIALSTLVFLALSFMGDMEPEAFIIYITAAGLLPKPIRQLSEINSAIQKGIAAAESIFNLIDEDIEKDTGTHNNDIVEGKLEFKNISFSYPNTEKIILNNFSLTIEAGKTVALVGQSGSGKSTLANLIPRFYDITHGELLLDGISINDYPLSNLRDQISYVAQNVTLFNDTIRNNIAYGKLKTKSEEEVIEAAINAHVMDFVQDQPQGLETITGEDGVLLSGGQKQRLAIARALLKNSPILILDEATSALDTESETKIQDALNHVVKGRTTLIIAHRLSTIENADLIVVMNHGEIVEQGTHKELIEKGGYYNQLHKKDFD